MLSPKMQRTIRVNDNQLIMLSERAHFDHAQAGYLHKRSADNSKWQLRWFVLYQNMMFYYDSENCHRPSGVLMLEGCYCERLISTGSSSKSKDGAERQFCFAISYRRENLRQYELRALSDEECKNWIDAIRDASFNKLLLQKEMLEQKHLHLLQIIESEKTAKWQYTQQCEELSCEIKKLRAELFALKREFTPTYRSASSFSLNDGASTSDSMPHLDQENLELRKIRKVQSFFRGWLCRRRWKQIVEQYIKSPHAESMRKRNSLVFRMVEAEEEYMEQMEVLVSCFFRPFKMAASSKKPPCTHEDINSIFLNTETVLFLHQIFLKGLTSRLENWPTLVLGDLFSMLLPMLSIYQEYVRNHHYSLQVLTECKQAGPFSQLLKRLENKTACHGRSLEQFLTYPMHQVPRYIITLHELLALTPHDHVERKSLLSARQQLEDLSRQMHDEVSETENLRKNLAVERLIVEGCDILLDVNQVFVRQGTLLQLPTEAPRSTRRKLHHFKSENKEGVRQCFLFSNHLIVTTRSSSGKLHLVPGIGEIALADAFLVEDPTEMGHGNESSVYLGAGTSQSTSGNEASGGPKDLQNRDFILILEMKSPFQGQVKKSTVHFVAPSIQEKAAWILDIGTCLDNLQYNDMLRPAVLDSASISIPHSIKNDPRLFKDEPDIRFSRTMNSCKVPQIRYATPERLLQRLTDIRFLSIDFLNTFLVTYRVFTDGITVLDALKRVFYNIDLEHQGSLMSLEVLPGKDENTLQLYDDRRRSSASPRRTSGASSVSGYGSESERDRSHSYDSQGHRHWKSNLQKYDEEPQEQNGSPKTPSIIKPTPPKPTEPPRPPHIKPISIRVEESQDTTFLSIPNVATSCSSETLTDATVLSAPCSPSNLSSTTLVGTSPSDNKDIQADIEKAVVEPVKDEKLVQVGFKEEKVIQVKVKDDKVAQVKVKEENVVQIKAKEEKVVQIKAKEEKVVQVKAKEEKVVQIKVKEEKPVPLKAKQEKVVQMKEKLVDIKKPSPKLDEKSGVRRKSVIRATSDEDPSEEANTFYSNVHRASCGSARSASITTGVSILQSYYGSRRSIQHEGERSARSSFQHESPMKSSKAGVVITSFRQSKRRSSTSGAAAAFAIATSGSSNPRDLSPLRFDAKGHVLDPQDELNRYKENVISTACTMRVLNVLRHWISKHAQDFENNTRLKNFTIEFLDDIVYSPNLLPAEHKAAAHLLRLLTKEDDGSKVDIHLMLRPPITPSPESIETLSALEIAEQLTYLDHQIFIAITSEEFLGQAWMKADKATRAPNILLMTKRFNDVSRLVASEIITRSNLPERVAAIEKWAAVADISRCLHNFNGVLQICSAFTNSSIFRLKKTWEKVSKTTKQTIEKLQLVVSSDGRFRSLRDALHRCDPPCIPYLGLYLTDLSFIEEGTPNFTQEALLNFSKMRMIAHVIREIRHFQQTYYKIEMAQKVVNYILDRSLLLDDEDLYSTSLELEPRASRLSSSGLVCTY